MNAIYYLIETAGGWIYPYISRGAWEREDLRLMEADTRVTSWRRVGEHEYLNFIQEHPDKLHPEYTKKHPEALGSK